MLRARRAAGGLGASFFTLFQDITLDDRADIGRPAMEQQPLAWLFFEPFIVVSTFVVPNRLTGVITEGIETLCGEVAAFRASASAGPARALDQTDRARALHDLMPPGVAGPGCAA